MLRFVSGLCKASRLHLMLCGRVIKADVTSTLAVQRKTLVFPFAGGASHSGEGMT